ncbi:MAG: HIT domain-containing protein [Xanthomonadales bacterium]|nr:HIT domain-containing protein [Xanthomonadales bacterium]
MSDFLLHPQLLTDSHPVCELALCSVRLVDDARFPWLILVPRQPFLRELMDLAAEDQLALLKEVNRAGRVLQRLYPADKLNIAALGNMVPQLHVHVIARRRDDEAWPRPVWGVGDPRPYAPDRLGRDLADLAAALTGA